MDLLKYTQDFCKANKIKPTKTKGQNFLINDDIYDNIIKTAEITKDDVVLEIGPGLGFLTEKLAEVAKKVVTVELDDKLYELLVKKLEVNGIDNIEAIHMNVLDFMIDEWKHKENYKIVANLPYNITSVFLRKFLSAKHKPSSFVLMLQKEVAERIAAKPGKMSLLAISVQGYSKPEVIFKVPREDFWPAPAVDSAVIKIIVGSENEMIEDPKKFFQLVKFGFSAKRKMLKNNLSNGFILPQEEVLGKIKKAGFSEKVRAQELSVEEWKKLLTHFS